MSYPRVIFVDGPTAVGKGYFLTKLEEKLTSNKLTFKTIRAADVAVSKAPSEDRKYTNYDTDLDKIKLIAEGHTELLKVIASLLDEEKQDKVDVVLVDRSFASFIAYNLQGEFKSKLRSDYIKKYRKLLKSILGSYKTLYVQLSFNTGSVETDCIKAISRVKERADGKEVEEDWLTRIIQTYTTELTEVAVIFDDVLYTDSGDISSVKLTSTSPSVSKVTKLKSPKERLKNWKRA